MAGRKKERCFMHTNSKNRIKVMVVVGTRPEAIKVAPVIERLKRQPDEFETIIVATAQHRELLDQALALFHISPDIDLNLMNSGQGLPMLTSRILESMSVTLSDVKPDIVLVQGDTTTAFTSTLAAFYQQIAVAHIEAGLRSYKKYSPFPEEINRRLTTVMADIHFAPTPLAKEALLSEGVAADEIVITGNTVVDAVMHVSQLPFFFHNSVLGNVDLNKHRLILVTSHRRESWGLELQNICEAIKELVQNHPDIVVVYPVHPNPVVKNTAEQILGGLERIHLVEPLNYMTFVNVMKKAYIILTDSGGLQEEAPTLKKPLLLLRDVTERPEAFEAGLAKAIGTDRGKIVHEVDNLLNDDNLYRTMTDSHNPYGDGKAADRIVTALFRWANGKKPLLSPFVEFEPQAVEVDLLCQNQ
jgi:UDP-N-acetylglucosamine 2-epimerase (non-hydrolysing)